MDAAILAIIQGNTITFGIASFIVLIGAAVKTATGFLDFYEEFLVKRYANRLDHLSVYQSVEEKRSLSDSIGHRMLSRKSKDAYGSLSARYSKQE